MGIFSLTQNLSAWSTIIIRAISSMDLLRNDMPVGLLISYKNKEKWQMVATF
jgi:hypothetical protein